MCGAVTKKKKKNSATVPRLSTTRFIRECTNVLLSIFRKKCLFLFFLSVVTNHLIECTMNELKLKMDVTVHLITSAYDMGNKSTATTIQ